MRSKIVGEISASGPGCRHRVAEKLLEMLCRSGCVLDKMETADVGLRGGVIITYTVSGIDAELAVFRPLAKG